MPKTVSMQINFCTECPYHRVWEQESFQRIYPSKIHRCHHPKYMWQMMVDRDFTTPFPQWCPLPDVKVPDAKDEKPLKIKLSEAQKKFLSRVYAEMPNDSDNNWTEPSPDDDPKTIQALHKKGLLRLDGDLFCLTRDGIEIAKTLKES